MKQRARRRVLRERIWSRPRIATMTMLWKRERAADVDLNRRALPCGADTNPPGCTWLQGCDCARCDDIPEGACAAEFYGGVAG